MSTQETREISGEISGAIDSAAINLADASISHGTDLKESAGSIGKLAAGISPESVDESSEDFRAGASKALETVYAHLAERIPDKAIMEFLQERPNAQLFTRIASLPGVVDSFIVKEDSEKPIKDSLQNFGLIEPSKNPNLMPNEKAWDLTEFGKQTYLRFLDELVKATGVDEVTFGLKGILSSKK